jgi:hypothetical protein
MKLRGFLCLRSMIVCNRDPGQKSGTWTIELMQLCRVKYHSPSIVARRSMHIIDTTLYVIRGPFGRSR